MTYDHASETACEAVIEDLHAIHGVWYRIVDRPDERIRDHKAVDFILEHEKRQIAVEHTLIESFPGQIEDARRVAALLEPLILELPAQLPEGWFHLVAKPGAVAGLTKPQPVRDALRAWILEVAPSLSLGNAQAAPDHFATGGPPTIPFDAKLYRWPERSRGREFTYYYHPPEDLEQKRLDRMRTALLKKCPKLEAARDGYRQTILILEDRDLAMSNVVLNTDAYRLAATGLNVPQPDFVYWVDAPFPPGLAYLIGP